MATWPNASSAVTVAEDGVPATTAFEGRPDRRRSVAALLITVTLGVGPVGETEVPVKPLLVVALESHG